MADPRFFHNYGPFTLEALLNILGKSAPKSYENTTIDDVAVLSKAQKNNISYLKEKKLLSSLEQSKAGFCLMPENLVSHAPTGMVPIISDDAHRDYTLLANHFYKDVLNPVRAIHETAVIDESAEIGQNVKIGAYAVIEKGVVIGDDSIIEPHAHISHAILGKRVLICKGAQIGRAGFGFVQSQTGVLKVPHLGRVIIHDDVEIGANTTVDRGVGDDTVIGMGTKIDSLVQIGHNVKVGRFCFFAGQVGISGSTVVGDFVHMGGQVGVADHLTIGNNVKIAARSGLMHDVADNQIIGGAPAVPIKQFMRQIAVIKKLTER